MAASGHIAPIVKLKQAAIRTGEENEQILLDMKAKLYRFDKEGTHWKLRGVGQVKILDDHKHTRKVRLLMRENRTSKICLNHMVISSTPLQEYPGNDKSLVWHAWDYSYGELKKELFCMRFGSAESAQDFKDVYKAGQLIYDHHDAGSLSLLPEHLRYTLFKSINRSIKDQGTLAVVTQMQ